MRKNLELAILLCLGTAAMAQTPFGRNHRAIKPGPHGVSAIEFDFNRDSIRDGAPELEFQLPDRPSAVRLDRLAFESRGTDSGVWVGTADKRLDSDVMLTFHEGFVAGTIRAGQDLYEVRPGPNGQIVEKVDPASFPACGGTGEATAAADGSAGPSFAAGATAASAPNAAGIYTIDLLSVYTPQTRAAAGGAAQITAVIQAAVDAANQAFVNSGVNIVYRLAGTAEVAHDDAGDLNVDLAWVAADATTAALRDQLGADLVSLVVENGAGYCGMGFAMRTPGPGFAASAFQVTARNCALSNLSMAHEHGHNLGMEHDAANGPAPSAASYPWSFGYSVNGVFRTVMSYATACPNGCNRVPYFSNPNVAYLGYPTGVANTSENARTANLTAAIVAAFRSAPASAPPAAPTGLAVTGVNTSQVGLSWTDQSGDETGFRVERSQGGGAYALVGSVGANVTTFLDSGLAASTQYSYRVRAYNAAGDSANSASVAATTQGIAAPAAPAGLSAAAASSTQINLSWTDASNNESGFRIERSSGGSAFVEIATVGAGVRSFASTGLGASTAYSYRVRAYNSGGNSDYSNTAAATTQAAVTGVPPTPAGFSGTIQLTPSRVLNSIRLSWTDTRGETGYRLEKCKADSLTAACAYAPFRTLGANTRSTSDTTVYNARGIYKYRLRAENASGASDWVETTVDAR